MNDGAGSRERLRMIVEAESRELRHTKLLAQNPLGVTALENPVFETAFDAAGAFEQRGFGGFKKLLWTRKQRFARVKKLQFIANSLVRIGARKFRRLKFAGRKVHERQAHWRTGRMFCDGG